MLEALSNLLPQRVDDPMWWRYEWLPLAALRLSLAVLAALNAFSFLRGQTLPVERRLLLTFSAIIGLAVVLMGFAWRPENRFQAAITVRQYVYLMLAVACSVAWWYVLVRRPVVLTIGSFLHGWLWCAWLWPAFVLSATGKGGLLWFIIQWSGNRAAWVTVSEICLCLQVAIAGIWCISIASGSGSTGLEHRPDAVNFAL